MRLADTDWLVAHFSGQVLTMPFFTLELQIFEAGIAQLVEHNLAKVGVASSSLVSRSKFSSLDFFEAFLCRDRMGRLGPALIWARWQSGHAAACKAVDAGSIPTLASILESKNV